MTSYRLVVYKEETDQPSIILTNVKFPTLHSLTNALRNALGREIGYSAQNLAVSSEPRPIEDDITIRESTDADIETLNSINFLEEILLTDMTISDIKPSAPSKKELAGEAKGEKSMNIAKKESGRADTNVTIMMREAALKQAEIHVKEDTTREVGGMLLGCFATRSSHSEEICVIVTGIVRARKAVQSITRLNFTPEAWVDILYHVDNDPVYGDESNWQIVGWYHSHPNFGAFFSSWDVNVHEQFRHPGHIALVIDPVRDEEAYFCWDKEQKKVIGCNEQHILKVSDTKLVDTLRKLGNPMASLPVPEVDTDMVAHDTQSKAQGSQPADTAVVKGEVVTNHGEAMGTESKDKSGSEEMFPSLKQSQVLPTDADIAPEHSTSLDETLQPDVGVTND